MPSSAGRILLTQVLSASLFWGVLSAEFFCNPEDACNSFSPGKRTMDPLDCHNYYLCIESEKGTVPSDQPVPCPPGKYYNFKLGHCLPKKTNCTNPCLNRNCSTECDGMVGIKTAYPGDCHKYYACISNDEKVEAECSDDKPFFDGTECSTDPNSCCALCEPYCEKANTEVRDPTNCKAFYICSKANTTPTPDQRYECDSNMHFDSDVGTCVTNEESEPECENLCYA